MRISIGIPAYNAERYLGSTLDSVLAQTFREWECIVVNDGSRDSTAKIAQRYAEKDSRIRYLTQENSGVAAARNRAFKEMRSTEYVIFLDADDIWDSDALEVLVNALDAAPNAVAVHGTARYMDAAGQLFALGSLENWCAEPRRAVARWIGPVPQDRTTFAVLAWRLSIPTPGDVLIRRSALDLVAEWDPAVVPCEDWDMFLRLSACGDFVYVDRPVLSYRKHGGGGSANQKRITQSYRRVRRKVFASSDYSVEHKRLYHRCYLGHNYEMLLFFRNSLRDAVERRDVRSTLINLMQLTKRSFVQICRFVP